MLRQIIEGNFYSYVRFDGYNGRGSREFDSAAHRHGSDAHLPSAHFVVLVFRRPGRRGFHPAAAVGWDAGASSPSYVQRSERARWRRCRSATRLRPPPRVPTLAVGRTVIEISLSANALVTIPPTIDMRSSRYRPFLNWAPW